MPPLPPLVTDSLHRKATERRAMFKDLRKTARATGVLLAVPLVLDLLRVNSLYVANAGPSIFRYIAQVYGPYLSGLDFLLLLGGIGVLTWTVHQFRHRGDASEFTLASYPPIPDLRQCDDLFLGSSYTRDGKQPGDLVAEDVDLLEHPHAIWKERGIVANMLITGGVGSGKTEAMLKPMIFQIINKYPKPLLPSHLRVTQPAAAAAEREQHVAQRRFSRTYAWLRAHAGLRWTPADGPLGPPTALGQAAQSSATSLGKAGFAGAAEALATFAQGTRTKAADDPYAGLDQAGAQRLYDKLLADHRTRKCGLMMVDLKGDLSEFVLKVATLAGRADDVVILKPNGQWTYNPLLLSPKSLTMAELVLEGVAAVADGAQGPDFWRSTQVEFLTNVITILRAVAPHKCTFAEILRMARDEQLRAWYVGQAEQVRQEQVREESRLHSLGLVYTGMTVDPGAIEFFKDFDSEEADVQMQRAVVQGIKAFGRFFVDLELQGFLNPELPPTFDGFRRCFDHGALVILQMPVADFGPVGRVLGILTMADFMQVARRRVTDLTMNQQRMVYLIVDEFQNYLSTPLKEFIAVNRQSRVGCIFAHQSLGQLMRGNNNGFQVSVLDNCRTKTFMQATNGGSGMELSRILGSRTTDKVTQSLTNSLPSAAIKDLAATGGTIGENFSVQEIDKPHFSASDLMALRMGEAAVLLFDGEINQIPRQIKATPFYESHGTVMQAVAHVVPETEKPHPVVWLEGRSARDQDYLLLFTEANKFFIAHPLLTADGALGGVRLTADDGTLIVAYDTLLEHREHLAGVLMDESIKVGIPDAGPGLGLFWRLLDSPVANPVFLDAAWMSTATPPLPASGATPTTWDLLASQCGVTRDWPEIGAWEYVNSRHDGLRLTIQAESRALLRLYRLTVRRVMALGEDNVGLLLDTFRREASDALPDAEERFQTAIETDEGQTLGDAARAGLAIRCASPFTPSVTLVSADPVPADRSSTADHDDDGGPPRAADDRGLGELDELAARSGTDGHGAGGGATPAVPVVAADPDTVASRWTHPPDDAADDLSGLA